MFPCRPSLRRCDGEADGRSQVLSREEGRVPAHFKSGVFVSFPLSLLPPSVPLPLPLSFPPSLPLPIPASLSLLPSLSPYPSLSLSPFLPPSLSLSLPLSLSFPPSLPLPPSLSPALPLSPFLLSFSVVHTSSCVPTVQADSYSQEELAAMFTRFSIRAPVTGNSVSPPMDFNLMFKTSIGPGGTTTGLVNVAQ